MATRAQVPSAQQLARKQKKKKNGNINIRGVLFVLLLNSRHPQHPITYLEKKIIKEKEKMKK